jgi:hypothetical protein
MKDVIKKLLRENLELNRIRVYRCIDGEFKGFNNRIEYFSVNKNYANKFGDNCYEFWINTNSKILNLEKWNKLYTDKTGKNGNRFNRHQGLFIIGDMAITSNYKEELSLFSEVMGEELSNQFLDELNSCDAIYGEDAGYKNEYVFAVKNKNILTV